MVQNSRNGTVGPYYATRACRVEEAMTKEGRDVARVGRATWHGRTTLAQGDCATKHGRAAFPVRARASWRLGFAFWHTVFLAAKVLL